MLPLLADTIVTRETLMRNRHPSITLVTPNYNGARYLEQTIRSVISQEYPNLQYYIMDGGSNDDSLAIIQKYQSHLAGWTSEPDGGMYLAIQKGFQMGTGEVMGWLNSDDMLHPKSLWTVGAIFHDCRQVDWITGIETFYNRDGLTVEVGVPRQWSRNRFLAGNHKWIQQESTYWRRSLWQQAGACFHPDASLAGDFELWLRFFRHAELYTCKTLIGGFRRSGTSQLSSLHSQTYLKEVFEFLDREKSELGKHEMREIHWTERLERMKKHSPLFQRMLRKILCKMRYVTKCRDNFIHYDKEEDVFFSS